MFRLITILMLAFTLSLSAQQPAKRKATTQTTTTKSRPSGTKTKKQTPSSKTKGGKTKAKSSKSADASQITNKDIRKLQSEQADLKKQMSENESLLKSTRKDVKSQLSNLSLINAQIGEKQRYISGIQTEVDTLNTNISTLQGQLQVLEADLAECKRKYQHGVMYMYRNRQTQNKLMFIFSAKNFRQMYRRLRYAQEYTKYERAQGEIVKRKEEAVRQKRNELLGVKDQKSRLLAEGKQQQSQLEGQKKERQAVVNELNKKQSQLQSTIAQQRQKYNSLNAKIDALIQKEIAAAEARRKAEEAKRAQAQKAAQAKAERERQRELANANTKADAKSKSKAESKSKGKTTSKSESSAASSPKYYEADNVDRALSSSFEANRGRLPVPITGGYTISSRFGQYNVEGLNGVTLDNKGINLTGRAGAQARCVFDGEVSAIFSYGGMVNVIVRHGSYISVYCNLSSAAVRQGQKVSTRQTIGNVARDASGNCTLHFQLRKETTKLNPEAWIGR